MKYFLPTLIVLPVLEMYLLIKVGTYFGAFNTVGLILLTAFLGLSLIRRQGINVLTKAKIKFQKSEIPTQEILTGFFLVLGGLLLLIPGFITDVFGLTCLIPTIRRFFIDFLSVTFIHLTKFSSKKETPKSDWIDGEFKKEE